MKKFIITLLSGLALSLSGLVFAGGTVVEAPTAEENPAAQVAPVNEEMADTKECDAETADCEKEETVAAPEATECDAETVDCEKEETAAAPEVTDSPAQVAPVEETNAS